MGHSPGLRTVKSACSDMVRKERLELSHLAALEPKSSAYTNFATSALITPAIQLEILAIVYFKYLINNCLLGTESSDAGALTRAQILTQR